MQHRWPIPVLEVRKGELHKTTMRTTEQQQKNKQTMQNRSTKIEDLMEELQTLNKEMAETEDKKNTYGSEANSTYEETTEGTTSQANSTRKKQIKTNYTGFTRVKTNKKKKMDESNS